MVGNIKFKHLEMPLSTKIENQKQYNILGRAAEMQLLLQLQFVCRCKTSYSYLVCRYLSVFSPHMYVKSLSVSPEKDTDILSQSYSPVSQHFNNLVCIILDFQPFYRKSAWSMTLMISQ